MCGANTNEGEASTSQQQSGTTLLDKFSHGLIAKCASEVNVSEHFFKLCE